jgi:predicted nucleic acid-binding protein
MRVVVDTNVLVSGLLSPFGPPGVIVSLTAAGRLSLCSRARHGHPLHSECQQTKFL